MGDSETEHKQRAAARIGTVLREKWRLDALLGLGGMAAVYSATHRNGKLAAIKVLHPEAALVPDVKARFLREGYLANKVGHPGAVNILDDDVDVDGTVFLVMELLDGETLESRWNREKLLSWREAFVIADRVLDVLIAAHKKDIVHRDLKPGNVFICTDGSAKILDFGIARLQGIAQSIRDTGGHISLGTPGFMPPEQARGQWARVDGQSDLWSLGATMFAVISGRYVHEAATVNEQLLAAMTEPAVPIKTVLTELPDEIASVIDRALAFDKDKRWRDGAALREAVRSAYEQASGEPFAAAGALVVPNGARLRSVQPDAPTVAASDVDSLRLSSSRSVSSSRRESAAKPATVSTRKPWPLLIAGAGATLLIGGFFAMRPGPVGPVTEPARETPHSRPALLAPPPPTPAATAAPAPPSAPASADSASPPPKLPAARPAAGQKTRTTAKPPAFTTPPDPAVGDEAPTTTRPAASPAPTPAEPIDIFTRRK